MSAIASRWYWMHAGRRGGPVTWDELQDLARQGKLRADDWVWREGTEQWQRAGGARADGVPPAAVVPPAPVAAPPAVAHAIAPRVSRVVPLNQGPLPDPPIFDEAPPRRPASRGMKRMIYGTLFFFGGILGIVLTYDPESIVLGGIRYMPFRIAIIFGIIQLCRGIAEAGSDA